MVALLSLHFDVIGLLVLCLFLVSWIGLQCRIVVLPNHTHLLFAVLQSEAYKIAMATLSFACWAITNTFTKQP